MKKKLTKEDEEEIYRMAGTGIKQTIIAGEFGVSDGTISSLLKKHRKGLEDAEDTLRKIFEDTPVPPEKVDLEDVEITANDELSKQEIDELKEKFLKDSKEYLVTEPKKLSQADSDLKCIHDNYDEAQKERAKEFLKDSKETPEAEAFKRIMQENFELYKRKNIDYGNSFTEQFQEFKMQSVIFRLQDKVSRVKQLSMNPQEVSDESLIDTLRDLSNYAVMTIIELEKDNS